MASEVSICNLALANIGDAGVVTSISPPDGSAQAARCEVYFPHALRVVTEARDWAFATRRIALADLNNPTGTWLFRYAWPNNCARVLKILPPGSTNASEPTEDFIVEVDSSVGDRTILTNTPTATAVYVEYVTDPTRFSESFVTCLVSLLSSFLAGPLIKGVAGIKVGEFWYKRYLMDLTVAGAVDGSQHKPQDGYTPASVLARR